MAVSDLDSKNRNTVRILTWNSLKDVLPHAGYTVENARKRIDGKLTQCYKITGEWHDIAAIDKEFEQVLEAKAGRSSI